MQVDLKKSENIINVLRKQSENMAGKISELLCFKVDDVNATTKNHLIHHMFSQHFDITISRNHKLGEIGIGRNGTVAAIGLLIAIQIQILTSKACF